jgi:hypothetical protein
VKRLEEAAAQAKEVGGKQIALLRDSLQALGKSLSFSAFHVGTLFAANMM